MNKRYIKQCWLWLACLLAVVVMACNDDEGSGVPVIHSVRVTDPAKVDSTFVDASRGQMIVIQGENLQGVLEVYINDQSVGFNSNYNTSTHLITTIPAELKLVGENPELKNEIRVQTDHGVAIYAFHVLAPAPTISRYDVELTLTEDGTYQVVPGQELKMFGENFYEVERVYLTNVNPLSEEEEKSSVESTSVEEYDMQSFTVSKDFKIITVAMPTTVIQKGWLVVKCYSGITAYGFSSSVPKPVLTEISSDMPIPGTIVTLYGKNMLEVLKVEVNGEYTIPADKLTISPEQDKVSFILPTAPKEAGKLAIITLGGRAEVDFYHYTNLVLDFDTSSWWWAWGDHESQAETAQHGPVLHSGNYFGAEGLVDNQWWWGNLNFGGISYPAAIVGNTPVADIEVRFECYFGLDPLGTTYTMKFCDMEVGNYAPVDHITGEAPVGKWITCAIPLSAFTGVATYADFCAMNNGNFNINTRPSEASVSKSIATYFDNFRFVIIKK